MRKKGDRQNSHTIITTTNSSNTSNSKDTTPRTCTEFVLYLVAISFVLLFVFKIIARNPTLPLIEYYHHYQSSDAEDAVYNTAQDRSERLQFLFSKYESEVLYTLSNNVVRQGEEYFRMIPDASTGGKQFTMIDVDLCRTYTLLNLFELSQINRVDISSLYSHKPIAANENRILSVNPAPLGIGVSSRREILIVYTTCNQLPMTIMSLQYLRNTGKVADVVVIDDHSTDGTVEYIKKKGFAIISKDKATGLTDSWNIGYRLAVAMGYKHVLFTNNDVLLTAGAVHLMHHGLKSYPLVVPLTTDEGAGHHKLQSIFEALNVSSRFENFADDYRNAEFIQETLLRKYIYVPKEQRRCPSQTSVSYDNRPKFNGFCFGVNLELIEPAAFEPQVHLFDPADRIVGQEDSLTLRMEKTGLLPILLHCTFVYHFKSHTVSAANLTLFREVAERHNIHVIEHSSFPTVKLAYTDPVTQQAIKFNVDIREDLRWYHQTQMTETESAEFVKSMVEKAHLAALSSRLLEVEDATTNNKNSKYSSSSSTRKRKNPNDNNNSNNSNDVPLLLRTAEDPSSVDDAVDTVVANKNSNNTNDIDNSSNSSVSTLINTNLLSDASNNNNNNNHLEDEKDGVWSDLSCRPLTPTPLFPKSQEYDGFALDAAYANYPEMGWNIRSNPVCIYPSQWSPHCNKLLQPGHVFEPELYALAPSTTIVVAIAMSDPVATPAAGDIITAYELGQAMKQQFAKVKIKYLRRGAQWYSPRLLHDVDILITLLDDYDLTKVLPLYMDSSIPNYFTSNEFSCTKSYQVKPNLITIAWMRNWFHRWLTKPWLGNYDLLFTSSQLSKDFFDRISMSIGIKATCTNSCPHKANGFAPPVLPVKYRARIHAKYAPVHSGHGAGRGRWLMQTTSSEHDNNDDDHDENSTSTKNDKNNENRSSSNHGDSMEFDADFSGYTGDYYYEDDSTTTSRNNNDDDYYRYEQQQQQVEAENEEDSLLLVRHNIKSTNAFKSDSHSNNTSLHGDYDDYDNSSNNNTNRRRRQLRAVAGSIAANFHWSLFSPRVTTKTYVFPLATSRKFLRNASSLQDTIFLDLLQSASNTTIEAAKLFFKIDYLFTGSYFNAYRRVMDFDPASLHPKWQGKIVGNNWQKANVTKAWKNICTGYLPYDMVLEAYKYVKIVIDDANHVTYPWGSTNSRVFDALASGALVLSNGDIGMEEHFGAAVAAEGLSLPIYHTATELTELLTYYLEHDEERLRLVQIMQKVVLEEHSYKQRAIDLAKIVGENFNVLFSSREKQQQLRNSRSSEGLAAVSESEGRSSRANFENSNFDNSEEIVEDEDEGLLSELPSNRRSEKTRRGVRPGGRMLATISANTVDTIKENANSISSKVVTTSSSSSSDKKNEDKTKNLRSVSTTSEKEKQKEAKKDDKMSSSAVSSSTKTDSKKSDKAKKDAKDSKTTDTKKDKKESSKKKENSKKKDDGKKNKDTKKPSTKKEVKKSSSNADKSKTSSSKKKDTKSKNNNNSNKKKTSDNSTAVSSSAAAAAAFANSNHRKTSSYYHEHQGQGLCIGVRTTARDELWLPVLLRSLIVQHAKSKYRHRFPLQIFLSDTEAQTDYVQYLMELADTHNERFHYPYLQVVVGKRTSPKKQQNVLYGYDDTDRMLEVMLSKRRCGNNNNHNDALLNNSPLKKQRKKNNRHNKNTAFFSSEEEEEEEESAEEEEGEESGDNNNNNHGAKNRGVTKVVLSGGRLQNNYNNNNNQNNNYYSRQRFARTHTPLPSCEWVLFTNGDNMYNAAWFDKIAPFALRNTHDIIGWDFITHHARGEKNNVPNQMISIALQRGFVDLASVMLRTSLFGSTNIRFLEDAVFTQDMFLRDFRTVENVLRTYMNGSNSSSGGDNQDRIKLIHQCLLMHQ